MVESQGVVTAYSVRYRKVERVTRRNVDDISTIVETTNTSIVITDLEPNLRYAVSVAAKTSAGVGNYSDEVTLGCKLVMYASSGVSYLIDVLTFVDPNSVSQQSIPAASFWSHFVSGLVGK